MPSRSTWPRVTKTKPSMSLQSEDTWKLCGILESLLGQINTSRGDLPFARLPRKASFWLLSAESCPNTCSSQSSPCLLPRCTLRAHISSVHPPQNCDKLPYWWGSQQECLLSCRWSPSAMTEQLTWHLTYIQLLKSKQRKKRNSAIWISIKKKTIKNEKNRLGKYLHLPWKSSLKYTRKIKALIVKKGKAIKKRNINH